RLQELCTRRSVDHTVVTAHRNAQPLPNHEITIDDNRLLLDCADSEYPCFRWIDYRSELIEPEHSEIGDRERRARVLLGLQSPLTRASCKLARFSGNVGQPLFVCVEDDRCDETFLDRDSHADVHAIELPYRVPAPVRVHLGMLSK